MQMNDMILVSVDDHVCEPPDMWERHLAGEVEGPRAAAGPQAGRQRRLGVRGPADPQRRAERRGGPAPRGVRHGADGALAAAARLLRRRRAHRRHERQRRARLALLPHGAGLRRRALRPPGRGRRTPSSPSPCCAPTTTGTSTSGAASTRAASSRSRSRPSGTPRRWRARCGASPRKGCHAITFADNPGGARLSEPARRALGSLLEGLRRRGHGRLHPHRLRHAA